MLTLSNLAAIIQDGLNAALNNDEIEFHVWAHAGELTEAVREGNLVSYQIPANLRSVSSANENLILSMGANGLMLDIAIPVKEPKTSGAQTAAALAKIQGGQYPFVQYVTAAIDSFFAISKVYIQSDAQGVSFTVSMDAGRVNTGVVDVLPVLGECLTVSVFINATFLQGGVNARDVGIIVDGVKMPFQTAAFSRSKRLESDVWSGALNVQNLASASALSIDFTFPANADNTTTQAVKDLFDGEPNTAHFVEVNVGSVYDGMYLMMFDGLRMSAQGVLFAGISGALIETANRPEVLNFPAYMQVGYFAESMLITGNRTLLLSQDESSQPTYYIFAAGKIDSHSHGSLAVFPINVTADDYVYDPETDMYRLYVISSAAVTVALNNTTLEFKVVQEASNG